MENICSGAVYWIVGADADQYAKHWSRTGELARDD